MNIQGDVEPLVSSEMHGRFSPCRDVARHDWFGQKNQLMPARLYLSR